MTCHEVQADLSLYLYGELDFAREEACESHLDECAFCQSILHREKSWHASINAQQKDATPELLSSCRQNLRLHFNPGPGEAKDHLGFLNKMARMFDVRTTAWSSRFAIASILVMLGFAAGRVANRFTFVGQQPASMAAISFSDSPVTRIQNVRPGAGKQVQIVVEQVRNGEISGSADDEHVRELLLEGARNSFDPATRVYSVEMLTGQNGQDVRDALIASVENDQNAAVRLKALEGLRQFSMDESVRDALKFVLSHDRDPEVRTEAIDVLVPADRSLTVTPQLLQTLQDVVRLGQNDEYVRTRCLQAMQGLKAPSDAY